jgi:NAD(P)-dependent dehydrogenase (short-subunit alcohol dehydrogenase family)
MVMKDKVAMVHGGGGAIGGAVARAFAAAGARVYLAGRTRSRLEEVAADLGDAAAGVAEVDALDEPAVAGHAERVVADAGRIDVALNAASFPFVLDRPLADLSVAEVMQPIDDHLRANLVTAKAVAPHMAAAGAGTILTLSAAASRIVLPGTVGYGTACAAVEALSRRLAVELGPAGVRVVCLRSHLVADGPAAGSYTGELFRGRAAAAGVGVDRWLERYQQDATLLGRLPTLAQVADAAAFAASDQAAAITGAVVDLTCGNAVRTPAGALVGVLD